MNLQMICEDSIAGIGNCRPLFFRTMQKVLFTESMYTNNAVQNVIIPHIKQSIFVENIRCNVRIVFKVILRKQVFLEVRHSVFFQQNMQIKISTLVLQQNLSIFNEHYQFLYFGNKSKYYPVLRLISASVLARK